MLLTPPHRRRLVTETHDLDAGVRQPAGSGQRGSEVIPFWRIDNNQVDLVLRPIQLPVAVRAAAALPDLTFVLDHLGNVDVGAGMDGVWAANLADLAALPNTVCKLSGLATEAGAGWSVEMLRPYVGHLFATFGPDRLIFGSDWPVSTLATTYRGWIDAVEQLKSGLPGAQRAALFGETAARVYGLRQ